MIKYISISFILSILASQCWAEDAVFTSEQGRLYIPFVQFQNQLYQADLTYLPPDQLRLEATLTQSLPVQSDAIVPVYSDLSFYFIQYFHFKPTLCSQLKLFGEQCIPNT